MNCVRVAEAILSVCSATVSLVVLGVYSWVLHSSAVMLSLPPQTAARVCYHLVSPW